MFERIIRLAIEHRWLVILAVLGMAAFGIFNYKILPIDAVPDITNVQVQINTTSPGYSPLEIEQRITFSDRNRRWSDLPASGANPLTLALWPLASDRDLQGRHRHLLRAGQLVNRAHPGSQG